MPFVFLLPSIDYSFDFADGSCDDHESFLSHLGAPDDVNVSVDLRNWLFALEGAQEMSGNLWSDNHADADREDKSWHTSFKSLKINAKNSPKNLLSGCVKSHSAQKSTLELITVSTLLFLICPNDLSFCVPVSDLPCHCMFVHGQELWEMLGSKLVV